MDMAVRILRTLQELDELETGWRQLEQSLSDDKVLFCRWEFVRSFVRTFSPRGWFVIALFDKIQPSVPVAVFPLMRIVVEGTGLVLCKSLATRFCPYVEFPIASAYRDVAWDALQQILREYLACRILMVGPLHEDSKSYLHLLERYRFSKAMMWLSKPSYAYIDTRLEDFSTFRKGRKKSTFADAGRCKRRLEEKGALSFDVCHDEAELRARIADLCRSSELKFPETHFYSALDGWGRFYEDVSSRLARDGRLEFSSLLLDGAVIASSLCFVDRGRRHYQLTAYDPAFREMSPSKVLLEWLIRKTFDECGVFCFGAGLYPYKMDWCQTVADAKLIWFFLDEGAQDMLREHFSWEACGRIINA